MRLRRVGVVLLAFALGCTPRGAGIGGEALGEGGDDERLWKGGDAALDQAATRELSLALVRAELWGDPAPPVGELVELPGRRTFACLYGIDAVAVCGTATGKDLAASLTAAGQDLKARAGVKLQAVKRAETRLKVEVVTRVEDATWKEAWEKVGSADVARWGVWVGTGPERSFLLPSEVLERDLYSDSKKKKGIDRAGVLKALRARNPALGALESPFPYERLKTEAWVEGEAPDGVAAESFELYRTHDKAFPGLDPDLLLQRAVWAGDYLISSVRPDGHIRYEYLVGRDKDTSDYNILRHAGTTYSILQLYERTRFEPYLAASRQAIRFYLGFTKEDERKGPWGGGRVRWAHSAAEGPDIKLGGVGLGLVMLGQYVEATGDKTTYLEEARGFGRFLVSQQKTDGEFFYFASLDPTKFGKDEYSAYYPGEAILGLMRLWGWDQDPLWLATAERGAHWLIDVRDKGKKDENLENDHWLMIALSYLHAATGKQEYLEHSLRLARATKASQDKNAETAEKYVDWRGGYYKPPRNTPAAVRGEGLTAVLDTCAQAKQDCQWVRDVLESTVDHVMLSQYTPDALYWVRNPKKTMGGISGGIVDTSIRNDFVQHAMSAILGMERHIRTERGEAVPGGPQWSKRALAGERSAGLPPERVTDLRSETMRIRGASSWEAGVAGPDAAEAPGADAPRKEGDE